MRILGRALLLLLLCFLCAASSRIHPRDMAALREIRSSLADMDTRGGFFSTWNFSAGVDPCSSFAGVTCDASRVTVLSLGTGLSASPGLVGELSPAISQLTHLTQLILFAGDVTGAIPAKLGALRNLRILSLTGNRLTGEIPVQIFGLANLHTLDLSHNHLTGTLPPAFPVLGQLRVLVLAANRISGEMPLFLPNQILHLDLSNNNLSGTLPLGMPTSLRYLSTANNQMSGNLKGLDPLSDLEYLDLSSNQFSGILPETLFCRSITSVRLQRNNLTGGIPNSPPCPKSKGSAVDLSHNLLEGELTTALIGVEALFLNHNRLVGAVPKEYVESVKTGTMKTLYLQHNYLTEFPMEAGAALPETAAVCASFNCMKSPPSGLSGCPARTADQLSRPPGQCSTAHGGSRSDPSSAKYLP